MGCFFITQWAVLVAIAIPVFTSQLEKSREATDLSNVRSAYAEVMADYLANGAVSGTTASVTINQKEASWQMGADQAVLHTRVNGTEGSVSIPAFAAGKTIYTVAVDDAGSVTVSIS